MPAVSVLMVFHRDQPFLRPAIASVLAQTFRDFELVLVDNGTGLPAEALGELGRDPRLRWVRLPRNEGIPAGHNAGVRVAQADFIALMDYDDVSLPPRLEQQVAALRANPTLSFVSARATRINLEGQATGTVFCLPDPSTHRPYTQYAAAVVTPAGTGRRSLFEKLLYRAEFPFAADLDFQARAAEVGTMAMLPEILLHYRWYSTQTTQQRSLAIEQSRGAIQLTTARRRTGRSEDLSGALALVQADTAAESWRRVARSSCREGFPVLAAYQARRSLNLERSWASATAAVAIAGRAFRAAPAAERALVVRMFIRGPVKALGLRLA